MTRRDKILLYVVLMLAFVVLFVRFLLIPGIENHQQAAADLTEAQDAQIAMQDAIMLAGTYAAEKNTNWGELQTANASYYSLLSSDELDTLVTSLELNHNLQPDSLTIGEPVTQSLTYYTASENAGQRRCPSAAASVFAGDDDSDDDSITADTADTTAQGNAILQQILASDLILTMTSRAITAAWRSASAARARTVIFFDAGRHGRELPVRTACILLHRYPQLRRHRRQRRDGHGVQCIPERDPL